MPSSLAHRVIVINALASTGNTVEIAEQGADVQIVEQAGPTLEIVTAGVQGPPGPPGASADGYTHTQSAASDTWTVNHNLGRDTDVELTTLGGVRMLADIQHTSQNQVVVYFASPATGIAYVH